MDVSSMMFPSSFQYTSFRSFFLNKNIRRNLCRSNVSHNRRWNVARAYQISSRISQSEITTTTALSCCSVTWIKVVSVGPWQTFFGWRRKSLEKRQDDMGVCKKTCTKNCIKVTKSFEIGFGEKNMDSYCSILIFVEYERNFTTTNVSFPFLCSKSCLVLFSGSLGWNQHPATSKITVELIEFVGATFLKQICS